MKKPAIRAHSESKQAECYWMIVSKPTRTGFPGQVQSSLISLCQRGNRLSRAQQSLPIRTLLCSRQRRSLAEAARKGYRPENLHRLLMV
jgi:hypothetical protein